MTRDPSGSAAKHQVKDVCSLFFVSVYLKGESFSIVLWKFSSVISLRICLLLTWSEQEGQYGLSWHQSDIAAAPFCPATSRLVFARSCQLKSSVTFRPLTCHFASSTHTAAQKRPQPSIYPRACLSFPPSVAPAVAKAEGEFTAERIIHKSFCRWRRSHIWNHLRRIAVVFTRKVRAHGTLDPPSPCVAIAPQICAHSTHLKIEWGFAHIC